MNRKSVTLSVLIANAGNIPASLIRATVRQCGGWDSFREMARDLARGFAGAGDGFSGWIYHRETVAFTIRQKAAILEVAEEMAQDIYGRDSGAVELIAGFQCFRGQGGKPEYSQSEIAEALYNPRSENRTDVYNALAWFALEEVSHAYVRMLEDWED